MGGGGPFSENVRRMYERNSDGGAGADFAEEMEHTMCFSREPTAKGDDIAMYARRYYERHRETWWQRFRRRDDQADEFMIGLVSEVRRILKAAGEKL